MNGMGSHQSSKMLKDEWLSPPEIIRALGKFDLDPCAPISRPWPMASHHYTIEDDGFNSPWYGRVWLNPPYGNKTGAWLNKLADYGNGVALTFARTETAAFFGSVWGRADGILFMEGRVTFYDTLGIKAKWNGGAPSCLIAYGVENCESLKSSGLNGLFIDLSKAHFTGRAKVEVI